MDDISRSVHSAENARMSQYCEDLRCDDDKGNPNSDFTLLVKVFKRREEDYLRIVQELANDSQSQEKNSDLGQELLQREMQREEISKLCLENIKGRFETDAKLDAVK